MWRRTEEEEIGRNLGLQGIYSLALMWMLGREQGEELHPGQERRLRCEWGQKPMSQLKQVMKLELGLRRIGGMASKVGLLHWV